MKAIAHWSWFGMYMPPTNADLMVVFRSGSALLVCREAVRWDGQRWIVPTTGLPYNQPVLWWAEWPSPPPITDISTLPAQAAD